VEVAVKVGVGVLDAVGGITLGGNVVRGMI
jgi:hypothetical protein